MDCRDLQKPDIKKKKKGLRINTDITNLNTQKVRERKKATKCVGSRWLFRY